MADIEIGPLSDRLAEDEIADLSRALQKAGAPKLGNSDDGDSKTVARGLDDDVVAEFLDHLEANDIACDIYLPIEFDGRVEAADVRVGSLQSLDDVLEELREELSIDDDDDEDENEEEEEEADDDAEEADEDEDDDEDSGMTLVERQIRAVWKQFFDGAQTALDRKLPLFWTKG